MRHWTKLFAAALLALPLASCLWGPGKFTSTLELHRNGTFTLDYRGEIVLQMPEERVETPEPWNDTMAACADEPDKPRPCTREEIDQAKSAHERDQANAVSKRDENEKMAKLFG